MPIKKLDKIQTIEITRANIVKRKDIIESKAPNKGNNICMIGKWLVRIIYISALILCE